MLIFVHIYEILWLQQDFNIYVCNMFDTGQASRVLKICTSVGSLQTKNIKQQMCQKRERLDVLQEGSKTNGASIKSQPRWCCSGYSWINCQKRKINKFASIYHGHTSMQETLDGIDVKY
uniref:Protein RRP6-like 2 n=1 Tax=Tanacetum cinerariifolium TaxID=118510 RepID=A0A6L2JZT2_TANCI|nr:protein RRP6-like 2 [Tanacetum cinerariifolium]